MDVFCVDICEAAAAAAGAPVCVCVCVCVVVNCVQDCMPCPVGHGTMKTQQLPNNTATCNRESSTAFFLFQSRLIYSETRRLRLD